MSRLFTEDEVLVSGFLNVGLLHLETEVGQTIALCSQREESPGSKGHSAR